MSQQGIFSIAPDAQSGAPAENRMNGGSTDSAGNGNGSPFTTASNEPAQASPFTTVSQDSPFQQVQSNERNGIPQRRPEGQPPALGGGAVETEGQAPTAESEQQTAETNVFERVDQSQDQGQVGGPFQMNGFPQQSGGQVMEAAPVAPAQEASPFIAVQTDRHDYEAAKAGLEPQQDFAAVQPRYTQAQPPQAAQLAPAQQAQPVYTPQPAAQPASQEVPVAKLAPEIAAPAPQAPQAAQRVAPAFQQLELRAIFGVDHVLDTPQILQRARTLPGIRNVAVVGQNEAVALSNFRQAMQGMGFGDSNEMKLNAGGGTVDFITESDTTVAVLLEGGYGPGVQETLIIVAREIGKLS